MTLSVLNMLPSPTGQADSELELLVNVIRETAQITTSASACTLVLQTATQADEAPTLTIGDDDPIAEALARFCRSAMTPPAPHFSTLRPRPRKHRVQVDGETYVFLSLPLISHAGPNASVIGFAIDLDH